jgi:hypothetical protein
VQVGDGEVVAPFAEPAQVDPPVEPLAERLPLRDDALLALERPREVGTGIARAQREQLRFGRARRREVVPAVAAVREAGQELPVAALDRRRLPRLEERAPRGVRPSRFA